MLRKDKILLIYTGGTIGMGLDTQTGALKPLDFNHLIDRLPEFQYLETGIDVYQFEPPIDSSDMSTHTWAQLVSIIADRYNDYDGFVVLHGTDTMAYTASALSFMLENLTKPVILTGSQLPIGQLRTDGKGNLITSIELAASHYEDGTPIVPEVCIYFNGKLLRGNRATKQSANDFNAFASFNYPYLCEAGVDITFHKHNILKPDYSKPMLPHTAMDPNVAVVSLFPDIQEGVMTHLLDTPNLHAVVMRSYGSGNAPEREWLIKLLSEAHKRQILIVNISQCVNGAVEMERYNAGYQLKNAGVISGKDCTVEAAVTKLMFLKANCSSYEEIRLAMSKPIVGEMTID